ncbi:ATP-binding cassette domain-containing protein [Granulosicoccaceae sp. 1_MG-2023]|nr:ATP-binding cassette domain-containing protein [Granulosicoccaceae sp. 1_MG-2023]
MNHPSDTHPQHQLQVCDLVKSYGKVPALKGIDLHVDAGEFVALLGPNGAGKSTLFQLLSGLFVADSGRIRIDGRDLRDDPIGALAKLGIVFQQSTLDLDLSVRRNLLFHCDMHGMQGSRARIDSALQAMGLADNTRSAARALSGGNRRKVELIRALLHEPAILLMDEATVGLDPASRSELVRDVRALCKEQRLAVLWATHLVEEVEQADRVYILDKGTMLAHGTPAEILTQTASDSLLDAFLQLTGQTRHSGEGAA